MRAITYFEGFVQNQPVFRSVAVLLLVGGKHGRHSLGFSGGIYSWHSDWLQLLGWVSSKSPEVLKVNMLPTEVGGPH